MPAEQPIKPLEVRLLAYLALSALGANATIQAVKPAPTIAEPREVTLQFEAIKETLGRIEKSLDKTDGAFDLLRQQVSANTNVTTTILRDVQDHSRRIDKLEGRTP